MEIPKKIVWLASYPKSGNTWFRAFLTALLNDGEVDINNMKTDGIFSSRAIFDHFTDIDSTYLTDEEVKSIQPEVFNSLASEEKRKRLFIKVHDAYTFNQANKPIIPTESTYCAIYIIRNPLDVVASLANHNQSTIEEAIALMNNSEGSLATQKNNKNTAPQSKQLMLNWSDHVTSWVSQESFRVMIVRYEDLLLNTRQTFSKCCAFIKLDKTEIEIENAIQASSFNKLKEQEHEKYFSEKKGSGSFFRQAKLGEGIKKLNQPQIQVVINAHRPIMENYKYL